MSIAGTSETSVTSLLGDERGHPQPQPREPGGAHGDVARWCAADSREAATQYLSRKAQPCSSDADSDHVHVTSLELRLDVANNTVHEQRSRIRQLEGDLHVAKQQLAEALAQEAARSADTHRTAELEAALQQAQQAVQDKAAELARAEGCAAVAEGSLRAAEQQLADCMAEAQQAHDRKVAELQAQHVQQVEQEQEQQERASSRLREGLEARIDELSSANATLEVQLARERQRSKDLQTQLQREQSKHDAVKELMRHASELEAQNERLQAAAQEDRRRATKATQALDAAVTHERHQGELAVQGLQLKMQDAEREHDRALRQARGKLQRAETDLRSSKHQALHLAARVQELESLNAKKDLQLDSAVQQVTLMQHELEALRQGLSTRQAAMLEAARGEFAAALDACKADLEAARRQLSEQGLQVRRQAAALARVADILAVHAGEATPAPPADAAADVDPDKVVAIVDAVSGNMLDTQQAWEQERAGMVQSLEAAEAVRAQLEEMLQREREEGRRVAAEAAHAQGSMDATQATLRQQQEQLRELQSAQAAHIAAERALESCRTELAVTTAKAASAADECAKWQGTASALNLQVSKAHQEADAAAHETAALRAEAAAKEERIRELRAAMSTAREGAASSQSGLSALLDELQAACASTAAEVSRTQAVLSGGSDPQARVLASVLQAAGTALRAVPAEPGKCSAALAGVLSQLACGYSEAAGLVEERHRLHCILSNVNAKLHEAATAHASRLQGTTKPATLSMALVPVTWPSGTVVGGDTSGSSAPPVPLVDLLQQLTESVVSLIENLAVEKECLESEMMQARSDARDAHLQLKSMEAVLSSLRSHTALEHQEALLALEQAQLHVADLEAQNAELQLRALHAQQAVEGVRASAMNEWAGMKDEISRLMGAAEQAQLEAQSSVRRHMAEADDRVDRLQTKLDAAVEGEAVAKAGAEELRSKLASVQAELDNARQECSTQAAAGAALEEARVQVGRLEEQVEALQRQLADTKKGISVAAAKKAAAASEQAAKLKKANECLQGRVGELQEEVRKLQGHMRDGVRQLQHARELGTEAQLRIHEAEGRAARAEALMQKAAERRSAAEVDRKRAQEAAGRLEQQMLELRSRLEAAQARERAAQTDAERLRVTGSKREADSRQLAGALAQLEVAEVALRDSQATASRLLQDCTNVRKNNEDLHARLRGMEDQLCKVQQEERVARKDVADLQEALDACITELELARSALARHQQLQQQREEAEASASQSPGLPGLFTQHVVAFPMRAEYCFDSQANPGEQVALSRAMAHILGPQKMHTQPAAGALHPNKQLQRTLPGGSVAMDQLSPVTQAPSVYLHTPETPHGGHILPQPAVENASQRGGAVTPHPMEQAAAGSSTQAPSPNENARPDTAAGASSTQLADSRPQSACSSMGTVDVHDVRRLVVTVEGLQRLLQVKNQRIKELRAALEQAGTGSHSAVVAAPHSREAFVLEQRLAAAERQADNLKALNASLEGQLAEAHKARREAQVQVAAACAQAADAQSQRQATDGGALAEAREQVGNLTLALASRNAALQALQTQLATVSGRRSRCRSACTQTRDATGIAQVEATDVVAAVLLAPPPPLPPAVLGGDESDALHSLERIVGLWRQACESKDEQLAELQEELLVAQDAMHRTEVDHDALQHEAACLAEQRQAATTAVAELEGALAVAEERLGGAQAAEQRLRGRVAELEAELEDAHAGKEAAAEELREVGQGRAAAEERAARLEQQLGIADAQLSELQHSLQLEQLSSGSSASLRQQLAATKGQLEDARQQVTAAEEVAAGLEQRLRQQEAATEAAADGASSVLAARLDAAQNAEQKLLREMQDLEARLAVSHGELTTLQQERTQQDSQLAQMSERLAATEHQLSDALETIEQQTTALAALQAALSEAEERQQALGAAVANGAASAGELQAVHAQVRQLKQELSLAQQQLAIATKQADVLRARLGKAETELARVAADKRHLAVQEAHISEALQRYQRGVAMLSSALVQLQASQGDEGDNLLLSSMDCQHAVSGSKSMAVEQLVDELMLLMHRKDIEIASLLAQIAHLEAAFGSKSRDLGEQRAAAAQQATAVRRVREQLAWCSGEAESLRRQLADRDEHITRLRREIERQRR